MHTSRRERWFAAPSLRCSSACTVSPAAAPVRGPLLQPALPLEGVVASYGTRRQARVRRTARRQHCRDRRRCRGGGGRGDHRRPRRPPTSRRRSLRGWEGRGAPARGPWPPCRPLRRRRRRHRRLPVGGPPRRTVRLEPRAARAACEALVAPRPSPQEREARLGPRRCPRQPPRGGAPAQSHLWPLRAVRLGQRRKRASARICPYRWAHGGKERWAPAREGRGTCAELALRDAARAWACTQGPRASKSKQLGSSQLSLPRERRSHPQASASERPGNRYAIPNRPSARGGRSEAGGMRKPTCAGRTSGGARAGSRMECVCVWHARGSPCVRARV